MSVLTEVAGDAVGVATGGVWKVASIALLALLLVGGGVTGAGWWMAARDRDKGQANLAAERTRADQLGAAVREQNHAVDVLAAAKAAADARGLVAQQLAAANGRRFDGALAKLAGARATTCVDAMPAVNSLLEAVR